MLHRSLSAVALALCLAACAPLSAGTAAFPELRWIEDERVPMPLRVFPAAVDPDQVFVSSEQGLWRTRNGAATWELLRGTGPGAMGVISGVAVCPAKPAFVVLSSFDKGVFVSQDFGSTWTAAGGTDKGLAGLSVAFVTFPKEDRGWQTILVSHGERHPGISKSTDGGQSWRVLSPKRYFGPVASFGEKLAGVSSSLDEPDRWALVFTQNYGEDWRVVLAGVEAGQGCVVPIRRSWGGKLWWTDDVLWAVSRGRLLVSEDCEQDYIEVGPSGNRRWASVFTTPGPDPEEQWLWAYDPHVSGLVSAPASGFKDAAWRPNNRGLPVGPMIKRGACAAANSAGTQFFACINDILFIGTPVPRAGGPVILSARVEPLVRILPVSDDAKLREIGNNEKKAVQEKNVAAADALRKERDAILAGRQFAVSVRVSHTNGNKAVESVTVTPDLFDMKPVPLFDDGQHGDGPAGDGVWRGTFSPATIPVASKLRPKWQRALPGVFGLMVTAVDTNKSAFSSSAPMGIFVAAEPFKLRDGVTQWSGRGGGSASPVGYLKQGRVSTIPVGDPGKGTCGTEVQGRRGPWTMCWAQPTYGMDATGLEYAAFEFRGSPGAGDVSFCLVDVGVVDPNYPGRFVPLLGGGYVPAMDGQSRIVRIPLAKLVDNIRFLRPSIAGFGLRATADSAGGVYTIGQVWFEEKTPWKTDVTTLPVSGVDLIAVPETTVPRPAKERPRIDGVISGDAGWKEAARLGNFRPEQGGSDVRFSPTVLVAQDGVNLYLAAELPLNPKDKGKLNGNKSVHDGADLWNSDNVEFFIDPTGGGVSYYQVMINWKGATLDSFFSAAAYPDLSWEPKYASKVAVGTASWIVEVAIPLSAFDRTPQSPLSSEWFFNVSRHQPGTGAVCWSPVYGHSSHTPERFGKLKGMLRAVNAK